jgi:GNAT superfamily N-acetyltransferase
MHTSELEILTAETPAGRDALHAVMQATYHAEIDGVPPRWAGALVAAGVPVAYIVIDPARALERGGDSLPYAFIRDVATHPDYRGRGYFRALMEHSFAALRAQGLALVVTHGRHQLYRRFGFDVFTHHAGIFVTPAQIARAWGTAAPEAGAGRLIAIDEGRGFFPDLLVVRAVHAITAAECRAALLAAADAARARGLARILFEDPPAPSYGSHYPLRLAAETPFAAAARACGALVSVQGADPENGTVPDADWIKVLDVALLLRAATAGRAVERSAQAAGARAAVAFETEAGAATLECDGACVRVTDNPAPVLRWPAAALAQLITGYRSAALLAALHDTPLSGAGQALLDELFPPGWRFSRNESWVYPS